MPLYAALLDIIKSEAAIDNTRANAGLLTAQTKALNDKAAADEAMRKETQAFLAAQAAAGVESEGDTTASDEFGSNAQIKSINKSMTLAAQDAQLNRGLANVALRSGNYEKANQYLDNARQSQQNVTADRIRLQEQHKSLMANIGSTANSANADTFPQAAAQLEKLVPGILRKVKTDIDAEGNPVWGPTTQKSMEQLAHRSMTSYQQDDLGIKGYRLEQEAENIKLRQEREARQAQESTERARLAREGLTVRRQAIEQREQASLRADARHRDTAGYRESQQELARLRIEEKTVTDEQKRLDKTHEATQLPKYAQANDIALDAFDKFQKGGSREVTQPQYLAVKDALRRVNVDFKAGSGDKFKSQQLKDMMGVLQRTQAYWDSIGQGNQSVDPTTFQNTVRQINAAHLMITEAAAKRTLRSQNKLAEKGINPDTIDGHGDMALLERSGRAQRMKIPGSDKEVWLFGDAIKDPSKRGPGSTLVIPVPKQGKRRAPSAPPEDDEDEGDE